MPFEQSSFSPARVQILIGDVHERLRDLPDESVHCVVTSPPYFGLRDYGMADQIGLEETPDAFVAQMVGVFREVRRVLRKDGTLWLNLGDSYSAGDGTKRNRPQTNITPVNGVSVRMPRGATPSDDRATLARSFVGMPKPKDLIGIPWRVAFALQADGWYLRQDIIWHKPNPMPESVRDRCTKAHEYLFLLTKSGRYFYDAKAIADSAVSDHPSGNGFKRDSRLSYQNADGTARGNDEQWNGVGGIRNRRSVWTITTQPFPEAHFATFPPELPELCIKAGCPKGGTVLDPFFGAGTTGLVADRLGRNCIGIELNPGYAAIAEKRIRSAAPLFVNISAGAQP
jgi:DNA modification methylase